MRPYSDWSRDELLAELLAIQGRLSDLEGRDRASQVGVGEPSDDGSLAAQVQHAQKLESLGILAGGIAHDFNNLLCGILGGVELALDELEPEHDARVDLETVQRTAREATELCRQLLAYSGKGRFVVEPVDLSDLVRSMAQLLRVSAGKNVVLRLDLANDLPTAQADSSQMRQVIVNLVVNASEAIAGASGTVTIGTGAMVCDEAYLRTAYLDDKLPPGNYVFLEVCDTGCGMDANVKARLFDPFFTTKFTGRGLGLAAVQGIVRGHRGAIRVYSERGRGSTFKILFPASDDAVVERAPPVARPGWVGSGLVLMADDEPAVRTVGRRILERLGFRVLLANDGMEALELYEQHAADIVLVILDMTMPNLGGEETFRELRRRCPNVRVVLTSGYSEQEATSRFAGKGLAAFVQKPFQLASVRSTLQRVLER